MLHAKVRKEKSDARMEKREERRKGMKEEKKGQFTKITNICAVVLFSVRLFQLIIDK